MNCLTTTIVDCPSPSQVDPASHYNAGEEEGRSLVFVDLGKLFDVNLAVGERAV
jgi:hypothetical protein